MEKNKNGIDMASEPLLTAVEPCVHTRVARPDLAYASVVDGVLQKQCDERIVNYRFMNLSMFTHNRRSTFRSH